MQKIIALFNIPSWKTLILISLIYFTMIFIVKNPKPVYGDAGLMFLQTKQIVDSNFSTFRFDYKGSFYDTEGRYAPYTKPFLGKVGENYYIDFPPYFPFLNSLFYKWFGDRGLFLLPFFSLISSFYFLLQSGKVCNFNNAQNNFLLITFAFCTSVPLYNFTYHEYPIAICLLTVSVYFLLKSFHKTDASLDADLVYFGLIAGASQFFRLELIFIYLALVFSYIFFKKISITKALIFSSIGFIVPFCLLLFVNEYLHDHPLGLRYVLTLENSKSIMSNDRLYIIQMMLFSPLRGIFFQSPFTLASIFLFFFRKELTQLEKFLFFAIIIAFALILLSSPNDGDHIAPRYLFGTFPLFCILFVITIFKIESFQKNKIWVFLIFGTLVFSTVILIKNIRWLATSDKNVSTFNSKLKDIPEPIIIFREFASPLNLQNSYSDRIFFVAESDNDLNGLLKLLIEKNADGFVIAYNIFQSLISRSSRDQNSSEKSKVPLQNFDKRIKLMGKIENSPFIFSHFRIMKNLSIEE